MAVHRVAATSASAPPHSSLQEHTSSRRLWRQIIERTHARIGEAAICRWPALDGPGFEEAEQIHERLLALHTHFLHKTWGIATGLHISVAANHTAAIVAPGYAIDHDGESIFVLETPSIEAPLLAKAQMLGLALTFPGVLEWWLPEDVIPGAQVLLGAAFVSNGLITGAVDTSVRRYLKSFAAPRLASGVTSAAQTNWTDAMGPATWVQATVDTTAAGFISAPQYFAYVQPSGARLHLVSTTAHSFVACFIGAKAKQAQADGWTISWTGIESESL